MLNFNHPSQQVFSFLSLAVPVGFKVVMAIICGGLVGIERELKGKPAGVKTQILICLGACLYTEVSVLVSESFVDTGYHGDPARIAAQVVSGIGFLGAGAIMQSRASIIGLTTAATIWIVAAIGMCIGAGYPVVAFVFTVTVLFTLLAISKVENKFIGRGGPRALEIIFDDSDGQIRSQINQVMSNNEIALDDFDIARSGDHYTLRMQHASTPAIHKRFILDLWGIKGIREVKQLWNDAILCKVIVVRGQVQGVGFRAATLREAIRIGGLSGYVRNLSDGSVEIIVQGAESAIEQLFRWARRGPPTSRVTEAKADPLKIDTSLPDFEIR